MNGLFCDLRFALRMMRRSRWFTAMAVLTLAVGIGANTALFSLLDAVVLRALPYAEPDRLVEIWGEDGRRGGLRVPEPILNAIREQAKTLAAVAVHGPTAGVLRTRDGAVDVRGDRVSANFVEVMGVAPVAGRGFSAGDDASLLISHTFWQRYLDGSAEVIGRTVYLDEVPHTIVGLMPRTFRTGFGRNGEKEFWTTHISDSIRRQEREVGYELVARLAPGVTLDQARSEISAIAAAVQVKGWGKDGRRIAILSKKDEIVGDSAHALQFLLAAVAVVLVIVCANLAQLLLARSDRRAGEFAIRKAMGASHAQLIRLALLESALLATAGGVCGIAVAYELLPALLQLAPSDIPRIADASIDLRVLAAAIVLTLCTSVAFGLAPALRLSRSSVSQAIAHTGARFSLHGASFRSALVAGQVSASVALFVLAGLLGRTFLTLLPTDPGFEPASRTVFMISMPSKIYPKPADRISLMSDMVARVEAIPGIAEAAVGSNVPFSGDHLDVPIRREEDPDGPEVARADRRAISPDYFQVLQMPLAQGRVFTNADTANSERVVIVNQRLARSIAPGGDVLGRTVRLGRFSARIVGVVADARSTATSVEPLNEIYTPYAQTGDPFAYLIVRSRFDSGHLTAAIRKQIRAAAPGLPLRAAESAKSMEQLVRESMASPRFSATLITLFSATALLLSAMGVFGLVAYTVSLRRREFGIRAALGAKPKDLAATAIGAAAAWTAVGVATGIAAALFSTRYIESQLHGTKPLDPAMFLGAAMLMLLAAAAAAYFPARKACKADPVEALRYD